MSLVTGFGDLSNGFTVETPKSGNLLQEIIAIIYLNLLSALKCWALYSLQDKYVPCRLDLLHVQWVFIDCERVDPCGLWKGGVAPGSRRSKRMSHSKRRL